MTVETEKRTIDHVGDGTTTVFSYDFIVFESEHMVVLFDAVEQSSSLYSITGLGAQAGGTVVFITPPGSGVRIDLLRIVPQTQLTDYRRYDAFPAETHERALDLAAMGRQQIDQDLGNTILYSPLDTVATINRELPLLSELHGGTIAWEAPTTDFPNGRIVRADLTSAGSLLTTPYTQDWLTSGDAAAGRSKLDVPHLSESNLWKKPAGTIRQIFQSGDDTAEIDLFTPGVGTADNRRTRWQQAGDVGSLLNVLDNGDPAGNIARWNRGGAMAFGNPDGGLPAARGDINASVVRVHNRPLRNGADFGVFTSQGSSLVIPNVIFSENGYRGIKIHIPLITLATAAGFVNMSLLDASQQLVTATVYFSQYVVTDSTGFAPPVHTWGGSAIPFITSNVLQMNTGQISATIWIRNTNNGVLTFDLTVRGPRNAANEWRSIRHTGMLGVGGGPYTGISFNSDVNIVTATAYVTYGDTF